MSFRCDICKEASKPGEKLLLVPTKMVGVTYQHRNRDDSYGKEIVSEQKVCPRCV